MNDAPLVSVIMNCYNSDRYLKEAIQSVIDQTYQNWEIVFWDNRSTDQSAIIVTSFNDSRIKYFLADEHTGLGKARNAALAKSTGEYVSFLDCDDIWFSDKRFCIRELL
jgi:glycosyltransferase involved in cell wall biosynthesis